MGQFDFDKILECYGLRAKDLAPILFPNAKYPEKAIERVIKEKLSLDVKQVEALANYIGVPVSELFISSSWKGQVEEGHLIMIKGPYKARLNYNGSFITIYEDNKVIIQEILNTQNMTLQRFFEYLDTTIKNYKNGND